MFKVAPYELTQVVAEIPHPTMNVQMPIWKALLVDGESKVISHLIHGEYELTNTSWSKLQGKYHVSRDKLYTTVKGKGRPGGFQYQQKIQLKKPIKSELTISTLPSEFVNQ